ncbi:MAG: hypothetical protein COY58_06230 [Gammaproteobacteria bacterium CG_4_10_14_0_8_um_filter_38_16]|nr:MAG: hypothetical protein COY58_06230 [Gammaproteobacteria bacterium CG_4_10_14_0_8_um_filter_38_16]PJA03604.1 MAG: hypothetical protein COX72_04185 [Gammaproteobacteria bacterium CG_4_10_14_0_2_um_filter_38_22]PJB10465.1 MAG: hypothetical protein CO120_04750 [Gammaproteobacteria bacterium CG_4_9_14_3_um_filter_38_9]
MTSTTKISVYPYVIVGLLAGALLSILIPPDSFGILPYFPKNQTHLRLFFYFWTGFYALMFLLAYTHKRSLIQLMLTTLLPSFLASLPLYWQIHYTTSQFFLFIFFVQALNAFHIHYQTQQFKWHYPTLFLAVWHTFVKLYIALIFTLLCGIVFALCGELFKIIGITFITLLLSKNWFIIYFTTIFMSIGLFITDQSNTLVAQNRSVLLLICKYLFIPLSVIGILFIITSVFVTIQHHALPNSQAVFLSIAFFSALFLNAIYQDGTIENPYPRFLTGVYRIFIILTPVFSVLAIHALYFYGYNNIKTNGFNLSNASYLLNTLLLLTYNTSYAVIALLRRKNWLKSIESINIVLAIVMIMVTLIGAVPDVTKHFHSTHPVTVKIIKNNKR